MEFSEEVSEELPRLESPERSSPSSRKLRKSRLQHYIRKLKKSLAEHESVAVSSEVSKRKHLSTFEALEKAINLINESTANRRLAACPLMKSAPSKPGESSSDDSSPPSPAASSTSTSSVENVEKQILPGTPQSTSDSPQRQISERLWGTVQLSLPDGLITNSLSSPAIQQGLPKFEEVLSRNGCLLEILQGKGAQTLLLNAFCGISKRRMYARLRCGHVTRPFELLCEFIPNQRNPSICTATIQVLCLESATTPTSPVIFTTRHNASCALIYLDAASIPYLGHFPSEISGKSLFTFIHKDDVPLIQRAHKQLHETNGQLVSTPGLRLVSYNGNVIQVDSEWSAFVNPWTRSIEMIVGRHCIQPVSIVSMDCTGEPILEQSPAIPVERYRELDRSIHSLISKPVTERTKPEGQGSTTNLRNFIDNVVETLVEKQQVQEEVRSIQETQPVLSYNQINCLENVHRLLKSQSKFLELAGEREAKENDQTPEEPLTNAPTIPLTRELLQQHNRKWEAECKDTWKKRLSSKRIAVVSDDAPRQKTPRIRSEPQPYSISTAPLPPRPSNNFRQVSNPHQLPPLPVPAPTPLDQTAWSEYVRIVQLHLQNMATLDQSNNRRVIQQIAQRAQQERQLAALALTLQQVQIPQTSSSSTFNALPTLEH